MYTLPSRLPASTGQCCLALIFLQQSDSRKPAAATGSRQQRLCRGARCMEENGDESHQGHGPWDDSWWTGPISAPEHHLRRCRCGRKSGAPMPAHSRVPDASAAPPPGAWDICAQHSNQAWSPSHLPLSGCKILHRPLLCQWQAHQITVPWMFPLPDPNHDIRGLTSM